MDNPFHNNDISKFSQSAKTLNKKLKIKLFNKKKSDLILKLPQLNNSNNILRLKMKPNLTNNDTKNYDSSSFSSLNNEIISNSITDYKQKSRNYNNFFSIKKNSVLDNDYSFKKNKLLNPKENPTLNNNLNKSNINKNKNRTIINIYNTSVKNSSKFILLSSNNNTTTLNTLKTNTLATTNNSNRNSIKHNNTFNYNSNSSISSISNEPKLFKKSLTKKKIKKKLKKVTIKHSNSVKNNLNYLTQIKSSLYQKKSLKINKKKTKKILNNKINKEDIFLNFNKLKKKNTIIYRNSIKLMPKININNFHEKYKKNKNNINLNNNNNLNEDEKLTKFRNKHRNKIMKELIFLLNDSKINQIKNNFTEKYFTYIHNKYDKYYKYETQKKGNERLFLIEEYNYKYLNQIKFNYILNINIFYKIFHYLKLKNKVNLNYALSKFIVNKYHDNYNKIVFFIKYKGNFNYNISNFNLNQFSFLNHKYIIDFYKQDIFLTSFEEQKAFDKRVNFIIKKIKFYKNFNFKKKSKRKIHRLLQKQDSHSQKKTFMLIPISKSSNAIKNEIPKLKYNYIYDNSNSLGNLNNCNNNLFIISNTNSALKKNNTIKFPFDKIILNKNLVTTTSSESKNRRNAVAINYNSFLCKFNSKKLHSTKHLQYVKNDKMTKESALYRTVEIKMKMKQKLKSIEDILFFLIEENNKIEFQTLIEKYCVDIDIRDKKLNTFIIRAVQTDNYEIVNYLIEKGAKLNLQNNYGNTALHYAILNKNFKIVDLLIKNGANEEIKNKFGFTPYELNNISFQYNYKNEDDDFFNSEDDNNLKNDKE